MTLREWWLVFDQHAGRQRWGRLSESECASLDDTLKRARERERRELETEG